MINVDLEDLTSAIDMVSSGESCGLDTRAYVCIKTGKVWVTGFDDDDCEAPDLPNDLDENEQYIMAPDKRDLSLGRDLVLEFIKDILPSELERVYGYFRRKGAYNHFKRLLAEHDLADEWYSFEQQKTELELARWGEQYQLVVS